MSAPQQKRRNQAREARLPIVARLYRRGHSVRQIAEEVKKRLALDSYGSTTAHSDIKVLLKEWRKSSLQDIDDALQLELSRIDDTVRELWLQWEKSKEDYIRNTKIQRGAPKRDRGKGGSDDSGGIETYGVEEHRTNVVGLGNPAYIAEIRQQLAERRKLLGLYAPEKKDVSGDVSFTSYLIESGLLDDAEQQTETESP
jgi:hypothetical protein